MNQPINAVVINNLTVAYRDKAVLENVSLEIPAGVLAGIIGPNGAGKSTLIKTAIGLLKPIGGEVTMLGEKSETARKRAAYVPQRESVDWDFPASALDVALMGRYAKRGMFSRTTQADRDFARKCLEQVGMAEFADRQIGQLSGGQQQRVFLARALAQDAELYWLDEPFAGVDAASEAAIFALLKTLKDKGKTVIVVHHDLQTASTYFDWLILLNKVVVANGQTADVFTTERLQQAYGGRLTVLI